MLTELRIQNLAVVEVHLGNAVEALAYDTRGYTLVRGEIPYKNLDRLVKDLRFEPSGWFLAETPLDKLPAPFRERNPICYTGRAMSDPAEKLLDEAMKLPESERRALALRLLDTVGDETPEEVERAWIEEAQRRLDDHRAGRAQPIPWEEARKRIFARG